MSGFWTRAGGRPASTILLRLSTGEDGLAALLLDNAAGPVLLLDANGRVVRCNFALSQILGAASTAIPGAAADSMFEPATRLATKNAIAACLAGHPPDAAGFDATLSGPKGSKTVHITALPLREPDGTVSGALLHITDITARCELEAQLAHSQKLQATGQLAGGIAHDFNNLLTAILGAAEGIIERAPSGETRDDANQIRESAERGAALVRQLLAFGRQQTLQPQILAVNNVIASVSELLRRLLGGQIRLQIALEHPGRRVRADPTQLDQVLVNLAVNARDAMPGGGDITLRSGHVTIYAAQQAGAEIMPPGRYVTVEVEDTGAGIPPHVLPRIFDPFFTTKRDTGGSGLGLSSVHGIIRQSGGFLAVESTVGKGTTMRIYLPRWEGPAPPSPPPTETRVPTRPANTGIILLADDEDAVRNLAKRALIRAGWQVLDADSGESALEILHSRPPDAPRIVALVSDMVMPGMSGPELAAQIRSTSSDDRLPVIFISGYAESPVRGGLEQPATGFLAKPYRLADLVDAVREITHPLP